MTVPSIASAWELFNRGRFKKAEQQARAIIRRGENSPQMFLLIGVVHTKLDSPETAICYLEQACALMPGLVEAQNWLSFSYFRVGNFEEAKSHAELALELMPGQADALNNLGLSYFGLRRFAEAARAYEESIKADPNVANTYENFGSTLLELGEYTQAQAMFNKCIALHRDHEELRIIMARIEIAKQNPAQAVEEARRAIRFNPGSFLGHLVLGTALRLTGDPEALTVLEEAVRLNPESAEAYSELGGALEAAGRRTEARTALLKSLELKPEQGSSYFYLLTNHRADEELTQRAIQVLSSGEFSLSERSMLTYAVAKGLENLGRYFEAMSYFDQGKEIDHQIYRMGRPFERDEFARIHQTFIDVWGEERLQSLLPARNLSSQPIFILGMMRSGTTLTDQIISSHSQVRSAGERGFALNPGSLLAALCSGALSPEEIRVEAEKYATELLKISGPTLLVTDKMPTNYLVAGLIRFLFPGGKIIHVTRNPADTAISIWTTANQAPPPFSFKKADIVVGYREYQRAMQHWNDVLPSKSFLTVPYEDLVTKHEETVRGMIEYCGLPWEDACLHHELRSNLIATPSFWQARQPIYTSSLGRWEKYREVLGEFSKLQEPVQSDQNLGYSNPDRRVSVM